MAAADGYSKAYIDIEALTTVRVDLSTKLARLQRLTDSTECAMH